MTAEIVLCTLNAGYAHASLGLRCLRANLGELRPRSALLELTTKDRPADVAERLLGMQPRLVGFGVYVWNALETLRVVRVLKSVRPELVIVVGGPEVSHEAEAQEICALADHVVAGPGDVAFAEICRLRLSGGIAEKTWPEARPDLGGLVLPYGEYTDEDVAHRLIYVEASRGCPFTCSFCLSALDESAWPFPLEPFLVALGELRSRGAQHFKFVDRTFNLRTATSARILDQLLAWMAEGDRPLFAHFEVIPDHLPEALFQRLARFPPGSLQLEIGFQTFDPAVAARIRRRQDPERGLANLARLRRETHAHLHTDLIFGLPGETLAGFGAGFDRLVHVDPHEIQVGMLKRLRGAPLAADAARFGLVFDAEPPYTVLETPEADFATVQRMGRFSRYWELIGNSGRFAVTRALILGDAPFQRFLDLSDALFARRGRAHELAYETLVDDVFTWLTSAGGVDPQQAQDGLAADYAAVGARGSPACLAGRVQRRLSPATARPGHTQRQDRARRSVVAATE